MSDPSSQHAVYGSPPAALAETPVGAVQLSPLRPGSTAIESLPDGALSSITVAAPPGAVERRHVLAHALRSLRPGGRLVALAPKAKGGARLGSELTAFGCAVEEHSKAHQRICEAERPAELSGIIDAIEEGAPRFLDGVGLWSQPGIFSFDRIDPGSALLMEHLPSLKGRGADLGAGLGILARQILRSPAVDEVALVEVDRRALEAARRNLSDPRARFHWADATSLALSGLDFLVTNPPFHEEGLEDRGLGQRFIEASARSLARGGRLFLVANRHLPYEALLERQFRTFRVLADRGGYKVIEAVK